MTKQSCDAGKGGGAAVDADKKNNGEKRERDSMPAHAFPPHHPLLAATSAPLISPSHVFHILPPASSPPFTLPEIFLP